MRYAVLSDVHANLEALNAVLASVRKEGADQLLCAGDLVGYGADPVPCLDLLRGQRALAVCGNHDCACVGRMDTSWFNEHARAAVEWTAKRIAGEQKAYLEALPVTWFDPRVTVVHGSLFQPDQFHYIVDAAQAQLSMREQKTPVAFVGHTHVPGIFVEQGGKVQSFRRLALRTEPGARYLVNVGSVGQPRDRDPRAAWCLYDSDAGTIEIKRVDYPVTETQEKIIQNGLPPFLAERLALGY